MSENPIGNTENIRSSGELGISSITYSLWTGLIRQEAKQKRAMPFGITLPGLYEYSLHLPEKTRNAQMGEYLDSLGIKRSDCRGEICGLLEDCHERLSVPVYLRNKAPKLSGIVNSHRVEVGTAKPGRKRWLPFFVSQDSNHMTVSASPDVSVNMAYRGTDQVFLSEVKRQADFLHEVYGYTFSFFDVKKENEERLNRLKEAGKLQLSDWYARRKELYLWNTLSKKSLKDALRTFIHPTDTQNGASMLDKINELLVLFAGAAREYSGGHKTKEERLDLFINYMFGEGSLQQLDEQGMLSSDPAPVLKRTMFGEIMRRLNLNNAEIVNQYGDIFSSTQSPYLHEYDRYLDRTDFTFAEEKGEVKLVEVMPSS